MSKKQKQSQMVAIPTATLKALANMFTSKSGVEMSPIIKDLGRNTDLTTINLGLLMNGYNFEVPEIKYSIYTNTIDMHTLIHASLLNNTVKFEEREYCKDSEGKWMPRNYTSTRTITVEDWLNMEDNLPEGTELQPLPEEKA